MQSEWQVVAQLDNKEETLNDAEEEKGGEQWLIIRPANDKNHNKLATPAGLLEQKGFIPCLDQEDKEEIVFIKDYLPQPGQEVSLPTVLQPDNGQKEIITEKTDKNRLLRRGGLRRRRPDQGMVPTAFNLNVQP